MSYLLELIVEYLSLVYHITRTFDKLINLTKSFNRVISLLFGNLGLIILLSNLKVELLLSAQQKIDLSLQILHSSRLSSLLQFFAQFIRIDVVHDPTSLLDYLLLSLELILGFV